MTAYEMRISDWSSDVCSSDLNESPPATDAASFHKGEAAAIGIRIARRKKAQRFCVKREYLTQRREGAKQEKLDSRFRGNDGGGGMTDDRKATGWERGWQYVYIEVVAVSSKKTNKNKNI